MEDWRIGVALVVGLAGGFLARPFLLDSSSSVVTEPPARVIREVRSPEECAVALRKARRFAKGAVRREKADNKTLFTLLRVAYDLGARGDQEEFVGGLVRGEFESSQYDELWAEHVLAQEGFGWAGGGIYGSAAENPALICLEAAER